MKHHLRPTLLALILVISLLTLQIAPMLTFLPLPSVPMTRAQDMSPGCQYANDPSFDNSYPGFGFSNAFYAGEQFIAFAGGSYLPETEVVILWVNGYMMPWTYIPGTVTYTFRVSGRYNLAWGASSEALWTVLCVPAPHVPAEPPPSPAVFLADVCEPEDGFSADGWMTLDTDADDLGYLPVLWVGNSIEGPWVETGYSSAPYILNRPAVDALGALVGAADYHELWLKVTEGGQPMRLGSAIIGREARMDRLCGRE